MTADYMDNLQAMGIDTIDHFPRATATIDEIIRITQTLVDKGFAYEADGDVYFDVARDREYGKLSNRSIESMHGEGGEMAGRKHAAADFALWKSAKPGEPSWDSPWGKGRPGWHIECSAMSRKLLGETFDIHGGGLDLVFPHHENEIAQSECCPRQAAGQILDAQRPDAVVERSRQSRRPQHPRARPPATRPRKNRARSANRKGASPFRDLLKQFAGETIRFFLLSTHYRRPIDYSEERITEVEKGLADVLSLLPALRAGDGRELLQAADRPRAAPPGDPARPAMPLLGRVAALRERFLASMDDDFNTGGAIGVLHELVTALNKFVDDGNLEGRRQIERRGRRVAARRRHARFASWPPRWVCSASRSQIVRGRRRWPDRQTARAVDHACGPIHARPRILPWPTRFAIAWPRWASRSKTAPAAPAGRRQK